MAVGTPFYHSNAELLDTTTWKWQETAQYPFHVGIILAPVLFYQNAFFVIGGAHDGTVTPVDLIAKFVPATAQWTDVGKLKLKRFGHNSIVNDNYFMVYGGVDRDSNELLSERCSLSETLLFNCTTQSPVLTAEAKGYKRGSFVDID